MLLALAKFFDVVRGYYSLKNAASPDVLRLLALGSAAAKAGEAFKEQLDEGTKFVQQLVDENRAMTPEEAAVIDARIADRLEHIANTTI